MKLIKLDAIDSTNEFLKALTQQQQLENFTVVIAKSQTKGKGQMGTVWLSEPGKNLIMSVLIANFITDVKNVYALNIVVALAVIEVLELNHIPDLRIKWPNDIMSGNKKIAGILIENTIKSDAKITSIVGLGLNVNQINFENLPKASSLAVICNMEFDIDKLLNQIITKLKQKIVSWHTSADDFWSNYGAILFKKGIPIPFVDLKDRKFMGIIQGVSTTGKLQILLEDDSITEFESKEIQMLY